MMLPTKERSSRETVIALVAILTVGVLLTWWMVHQADHNMRDDLLRQARLVAQSVNLERLQILSGTEADLDSVDYLRLKEQLARAKQANDKCRFIYLMGLLPDGQVFFYVDNEPVGSKDESPAGQIYENVSPEFRHALNTSSEVVEGPVVDRWGMWISALVPLTDPQSNALIAMLGMDINAGTWRWELFADVVLPMGAMLALLIVLASGVVAIRFKGKVTIKPVQRRLLIPLAGALLLLVGGFGAALLYMQQKNLNQSSHEKLLTAAKEFNDGLSEDTELLTALEVILVCHMDLHDALKAQDRDRLLANYKPVFEQLRTDRESIGSLLRLIKLHISTSTARTG